MIKRDSAHTKAVKLAKQRESYKCELCGRITDIHGHHLEDVGFGEDPEVEYILVVCEICHDEIHSGKIKIETYDYRKNK